MNSEAIRSFATLVAAVFMSGMLLTAAAGPIV